LIDTNTAYEIDRVVEKTLKYAGLKEPPILVEDLLRYLDLDRQFYDLENPNFLERVIHSIRVKKHRLIVEGKKFLPHKDNLVKTLRKLKFSAFWFPDQDRICIDASLPTPKQTWASFHDTVHRLLEWHRSYFIGDTLNSLDPTYQETLEAEANYGASALMFGGQIFTVEALEYEPCWKSVTKLKNRYNQSYATTLRRFVCFSHDIPMAAIISTPWWNEPSSMFSADAQEGFCRHFVPSKLFWEQFSSSCKDVIMEKINEHTIPHRGGPVGSFEMLLPDVNGNLHFFDAESFFNTHDVLTLIVLNKH
jgi:hypothetical protein